MNLIYLNCNEDGPDMRQMKEIQYVRNDWRDLNQYIERRGTAPICRIENLNWTKITQRNLNHFISFPFKNNILTRIELIKIIKNNNQMISPSYSSVHWIPQTLWSRTLNKKIIIRKMVILKCWTHLKSHKEVRWFNHSILMPRLMRRKNRNSQSYYIFYRNSKSWWRSWLQRIIMRNLTRNVLAEHNAKIIHLFEMCDFYHLCDDRIRVYRLRCTLLQLFPPIESALSIWMYQNNWINECEHDSKVCFHRRTCCCLGSLLDSRTWNKTNEQKVE